MNDELNVRFVYDNFGDGKWLVRQGHFFGDKPIAFGATSFSKNVILWCHNNLPSYRGCMDGRQIILTERDALYFKMHWGVMISGG
jgi:hypothetical protein